MLADQSAGPNGVKYFEGGRGYPWGNIGKKIRNFSFLKTNFSSKIVFSFKIRLKKFHGKRRILRLMLYNSKK